MTPTGPAPANGGSQGLLDSHVHFWDPRRLTYPWLGQIPPLDRPFTPGHFAGLHPEPVEVIFIEAGRAPGGAAAEVEWVRHEARNQPWIRGAVAHAQLENPAQARDVIRGYADDPFVLGVRRNIQDETAGFTTSAGFRAGVRLLGRAGLPFDACVRAHQLPELAELAAACPQTTIVLDHLGKPPAEARGPGTTTWRQAMRRLARRDNIVCKLSGLATEAAPGTGESAMAFVLREALDIFGPGRCLYGSDWPVMTLATRYQAWLDLVRAVLTEHPPAAAGAVLGGNAARIYRVSLATSAREPARGEDPV
jgi:L-fuconolactonase